MNDVTGERSVTGGRTSQSPSADSAIPAQHAQRTADSERIACWTAGASALTTTSLLPLPPPGAWPSCP